MYPLEKILSLEIKMSSIFTKIINGEVSSYKIYEDELIFSFLAVPQNELGHTLVIPKREIDYFIDVPLDLYLDVQKKSYYIAKAIQLATNCKKVGTITQGFEVAHYHHHLIPLFSGQEFSFANAKNRTDEQMREIQEKILSFLSL